MERMNQHISSNNGTVVTYKCSFFYSEIDTEKWNICVYVCNFLKCM
jgi:hypothetical protein